MGLKVMITITNIITTIIRMTMRMNTITTIRMRNTITRDSGLFRKLKK